MKNLYIQTQKVIYGSSVLGSDDKIIDYFTETMQGEFCQETGELSIPVASISQMIDFLTEQDESKIEPMVMRYFPAYHNLFPDYRRLCSYLKHCLKTILDTADASDGIVKLTWKDNEQA